MNYSESAITLNNAIACHSEMIIMAGNYTIGLGSDKDGQSKYIGE